MTPQSDRVTGAVTPQSDWTGRVGALAPALRACLEGAGPAAFVTDAAQAGQDMLRVILHEDGRTAACILREGRVVARAALPGAAPPDPAAPAFFLERRCVDARRVDAPDGTVLGWMAYPAC